MARTLKEVLPPHDVLLGLEPEVIATFLLDYLCELEEESPRGSPLGRYNFTLEDRFASYAGDERKEVAKVIMEAWVWLENEGLLAPKIGDSTGMFGFVTRKGYKLRKREDLESYKKGFLLPKNVLDAELREKVYNLFLNGDYDTAVFRAFKEVEVRTREKAKLPASLLGVKLMRTAFHPDTGMLTNKEMEPGEKQAMSDIFSGAIGTLKNPSSHRNVNLDDPAETAEIILFANYLLRLVDRCKKVK